MKLRIKVAATREHKIMVKHAELHICMRHDRRKRWENAHIYIRDLHTI